MPMRTPAAVVLGAIATVLVMGCGASDERSVRKTLDTFATATAKKDFQTICDEVFSSKLVAQVRREVPCELALGRSSLADARRPLLEIRDVEVDGDRASARVRSSAANQPPSEDTVELVREDDEWRIAALSSPEQE